MDAKIGFGESYMAGDWSVDTSDALADVLAPFAERMATLIPPALQRFRRFVDRGHPAQEENTVEGARSNVHRHYDLSNELFSTFLDETMTYSSALFAPGDDLAAAQRASAPATSRSTSSPSPDRRGPSRPTPPAPG
ncbi:cyclopropane-fatty-acyl-phospholipid synthase [Amycolatopsis marina]|uniref:Cyclopropane-fatty-acyl-phospholipid synthase n=1 Tax=Amycolatopsis marina TaxID=490629 RepID=A0A1I0Z4Y2_9PSEU|nr:cyclopropane-fatty-acyl-phospholipid synthase [Amycolatopsis marina]